jgi:hypothetical protein
MRRPVGPVNLRTTDIPTTPNPEPSTAERFDRYFPVIDNPGGGNTDGKVSTRDLERVASGDYDRQTARERLVAEGVTSEHVDAALRDVERTAQELLDNESLRERLDVANDNGGNVDGIISRGDLDRYLIDHPGAGSRQSLDLDQLLSSYLQDRRGDGEVDQALQRYWDDVDARAEQDPEHAGDIRLRAERVVEDRAGDIQAARRADDNFFQRANHAATGAVRGGGDAVAGGIRWAGDTGGDLAGVPLRVGGELINATITGTGQVAGGGLDLVGADGVADQVRGATSDAGNAVNETSDAAAAAVAIPATGWSELLAAKTEFASEALADPVGTGRDPVGTFQDGIDDDRLLDVAGELEIQGGQAVSEVQQSIGLEPEGQSLTDYLEGKDEERRRIEAIFGDSIDLDQVVVVEGSDVGLFDSSLNEGRPFVLGNRVYLKDRPEDLIHELVHVWQYQNGGSGYAPEAQIAQELGAGYEYEPAVAAGARFEDLNPEQQGELIAEAAESGFFDAPDQRLLLKQNPATDDYRRLVIDYDPARIDRLESAGYVDVTHILNDGLAQIRSGQVT